MNTETTVTPTPAAVPAQRLTWQHETRQFCNYHRGLLGKVAVFRVDWNSTKLKGGPYSIECMLPGMKANIDAERGYDEEPAKARCEQVLARWLQLTGLEGGAK